MDTECLGNAIRRLYEVIESLNETCGEHNRHFTLDGHLLGSIGEVYAAERFGIHLYTSSKKAHDGWIGMPDGTRRRVQIKVTQACTKRKVVPISHEPDYLIVLSVDEKGIFNEVYNGPGDKVWNLVRGRPRPSNGQYQIPISKLRELNTSVPTDDRIVRRET